MDEAEAKKYEVLKDEKGYIREVSVNPIGLLVVAGGLFTAGCGIFDWQWAMTSRQGRLVSRMITRAGARAFYVVVGMGMIVVGALMTIGVIEQT